MHPDAASRKPNSRNETSKNNQTIKPALPKLPLIQSRKRRLYRVKLLFPYIRFNLYENAHSPPVCSCARFVAAISYRLEARSQMSARSIKFSPFHEIRVSRRGRRRPGTLGKRIRYALPSARVPDVVCSAWSRPFACARVFCVFYANPSLCAHNRGTEQNAK